MVDINSVKFPTFSSSPHQAQAAASFIQYIPTPLIVAVSLPLFLSPLSPSLTKRALEMNTESKFPSTPAPATREDTPSSDESTLPLWYDSEPEGATVNFASPTELPQIYDEYNSLCYREPVRFAPLGILGFLIYILILVSFLSILCPPSSHHPSTSGR